MIVAGRARFAGLIELEAEPLLEHVADLESVVDPNFDLSVGFSDRGGQAVEVQTWRGGGDDSLERRRFALGDEAAQCGPCVGR